MICCLLGRFDGWVGSELLHCIDDLLFGWLDGFAIFAKFRNLDWKEILVFFIGLGPIVLDFSYVSEKLTDKSNEKIYQSNPGVANPNRSLGRNQKNFQKYWLFGPIFDKNCEKTLKISKSQQVLIHDWAAGISFWATCGPRAAGWPPLI